MPDVAALRAMVASLQAELAELKAVVKVLNKRAVTPDESTSPVPTGDVSMKETEAKVDGMVLPDVPRWEVLAVNSDSKGVNVRASKSRAAVVLGTKDCGAVVPGRQEEGWIALSGEPGYIMIECEFGVMLRRVAVVGDKRKSRDAVSESGSTGGELACSLRVLGTHGRHM